jgi:hypothetical protein
MPYLATETYIDENGRVRPKGVIERVDLMTNSMSLVNRNTAMVMFEGSVTFILDRTRKHMATLDTIKEQEEFMFGVLRTLNPNKGKYLEDVIYKNLSDKEKKRFIKNCISLDSEGRIITNNGLYVNDESFNEEFKRRDVIIDVYKKYGDVITPYHIFVPKPRWGRDIYLGKDYVGYQYILKLKQSGERGFSVRSAGSINDESLPEKSNDSKIGLSWHSSTPIRFGEYETPNFMVVTDPNDFALITALYRSSIDGRRFMYEAILSEDNNYNIPDNFTSRSAEILEVYLKSLGVRMETIFDDSEFIGEPEDDSSIVGYTIRNSTIFCTPNEMYYLKKLSKVYKRYKLDNPNAYYDIDEVWEYCLNNLPFKKKHLSENIVKIFKNNLEAFTN